jgi:hypothetical protein
MSNTSSRTLTGKSQNQTKWILGLFVLYLIVLIGGIQNNLPYLAEVDEPFFVLPAVRMASSGSLNPESFGHPGSTTIYPMALLFHLWYAFVEGGSLLHSNAQLETHFNQHFATYYYLGRLVSIAYAVFTLPLIYRLGQQAFRPVTGLVASGLFIFYPLLLNHAQMTRADSATVFFVALSLWLMLRLFETPSLSRHVLVGLVIGFGISTKYVLAALGPVYLLVCLIHLRQSWQTSQFAAQMAKTCLGLGMIVVGFAVTTPYFFLDFDTALENVLVEGRSEHLGADGLSKFGNFWFYLTAALPKIVGWPQLVLAYLAIGVGVWRRNFPQLILIAFVAVYLVGISISSLHWVRWALQVLPVMVLFAAEGISLVADRFAQVWRKRPYAYPTIFVAVLLLVSAGQIYDSVLHDIKQANPSTRILAREWLMENVPPNSKIGQEWYTAPLQGTTFEVVDTWALGQDRVVANYYDEAFNYLVVSSGMYNRFYADPERSPSQVQFYDSLNETAVLLQEIKPTTTRNGPTIKIYELSR